MIDHKDGDTDNNAIRNLRDATRSVNAQNLRHPLNTNKLGIQGVFYRRGRYAAQIHINGKSTYLGSFPTPEKAKAAYISGRTEEAK